MTEPSLLSGLFRQLLLLLAPILLAAWVLSRQFTGTSWGALAQSWHAHSPANIACAVALTGLSFACLGLFDRAAARVVAPSLNSGKAWMVGMVANAVSNTLGFHAVTGTVVRARLYARCGVGASDAVRIVSLSWLALGLGFLTMFGAAELVRGLAPPQHIGSLVIGLAICVSLGLLVGWLGGKQRRFTLWQFRQPLPTARAALQQMAIGAVESAAAIGALYVLLPVDLAPPFSIFAVGCIAAVALGVLSHVPGGLGVFEASVTLLLSGTGRADLLAALILYRAIYNLLPFVLSLMVLAALAVSDARGRVLV